MKVNSKILNYWNKDDVESMYDKHLLNAEINLIKKHIPENIKLLDAGCGEGEGTLSYSYIPGIKIHAVDFSNTRLKKAKKKLSKRNNITLKQVDFLDEYNLDKDYDVIVSQRFLINITNWDAQKKILLDLMSLLKRGGILIMMEGSKNGVDSLNKFRNAFNLKPIPVKWHNLFFDDDLLVDFMQEHSYKLLKKSGLGSYFFLTRGIRPIFDVDLNWDCEFNHIASTKETKEILGFEEEFSRLKLWVFQKNYINKI